MNPTPHTATVTQQNFDDQVLARSQQVPVLADFWAEWCGPCQQLMPVLAKLAAEYEGKFFLAKINSDTEQALAARYAVRSLPTVKLFRHGQVVTEFMGAQPERFIRALLDRHVARPSDNLVDNALQANRAGKHADALGLLQQAVRDDPANDRAILELARLHLEQGRVEAAETALASLSNDAKNGGEAVGLRARLDFTRVAGTARPPELLESVLATNARDNDARYELAAHLVLRQQHQAALEQLLEIVRTDRKFRDDAGRKAMVSVFNMLGGSGDLVKQYRAKLSMALN